MGGNKIQQGRIRPLTGRLPTLTFNFSIFSEISQIKTK